MDEIPQIAQISRRLRVVRLVALVDFVLLLALILAALTGQKEMVHILGPLHGINFLFLVVIVGIGAVDHLWAWWFPLAVLCTAGPPGAFIGEWLIMRRVKRLREEALNRDEEIKIDVTNVSSLSVEDNYPQLRQEHV